MSITDELMEWTRNHTVDCSDNRIALVTIAKRIEAEHQKAIRELNNLADASVLLPVDADGEVIHIGDEMEYGEARGRVIALMLSNYPKKWGGGLHWGIQLEGEQAPTALDGFFRHHHAPTVEDVLREFALKAAGRECMTLRRDLVDEYAAKLQLREDA